MKIIIALLGVLCIHYAHTTTVYICKGPGSRRYHYNKYCRGLKNCSTNIHEVTKSEARYMGRTLCGWED